MQELIEKIFDEARSAWRFRWLGLAIAAAVAVVGWCIIFALPDHYEAYASVFVDSRTALRPVLQGLTMEQDVNVQLNYVQQSLLTGEQLKKIASETGVLPATQNDPKIVASILDDFAKRVKISVRSAGREGDQNAGTIYSFDYLGKSRPAALKVIQTVQDAFIEQTLGGKRAGTESTLKFMEERMKEFEQRLRDGENRKAQFKEANIGLMPTEQGGYVVQLQNEVDLTRKSENDLSVAQARRAELERQLHGESVIGAAAVGVTGNGAAAGNDTNSRINEAQARLDELLQRFTDKHPDVVAARAQLAELKARRAAEIEQIKSGDASAVASSGVSTNPVYQSIQLQLNQADVDITSLRGQLSQHRAKVAELKQRLDEAPKVEAEYAQLTRDDDANKAQYAGMLANYQKAQLGERADDAGSVRFEKVQPPTAPFGPASPHRMLLLPLVLLVALGVGGGLSYLLHLLSPVVGSTRGLTELTGLPVLGVVSPAFPHDQAARRYGEMLRFVGMAGVLIIAFAGVILLNMLGFRMPHIGTG